MWFGSGEPSLGGDSQYTTIDFSTARTDIKILDQLLVGDKEIKMNKSSSTTHPVGSYTIDCDGGGSHAYNAEDGNLNCAEEYIVAGDQKSFVSPDCCAKLTQVSGVEWELVMDPVHTNDNSLEEMLAGCLGDTKHKRIST